MKKITLSLVCGLLALSSLLTSGCQSTSTRNVAESGAKPKHYIMTLHGIRGNEVSFGDFHTMIKSHLEQLDSTFEVVPLNITYSIARVDYTPESDGLEVQAKLEKMVPVINKEDKLSVVGYSMGGQVGLAWYLEALKKPESRKYADQLNQFIGLGSAFWGAKEAGLATSDIKVLKDTIKFITVEIRNALRENSSKYLPNFVTSGLEWVQNKTDAQIDAQLAKLKSIDQIQAFYDKYLRTNNMVKVSFNELKGLALGGVPATNLRLGLIGAPTYKTRWTTVLPLVQCFETNFGSKTAGCDDFQYPLFKFINDSVNKPYTFGYARRETDNAVITPSGNAQFLYVTESDRQYPDGYETPLSKTRPVLPPAQTQTYFTEALHATVVTADQYDKAVSKLSKLGDSWTRLAGDVVLVYKSNCETLEKCSQHPTYKYIVKTLADCEHNRCNSQAQREFLEPLVKPAKDAVDQAKLRSEIHGFTVELNLRVPKGYDISAIDDKTALNYIQFETEKIGENKVLKSSLNADSRIVIAREKEIASVLVKKMTQYVDQDQLKVNLTGLFIPQDNKKYDYASLEAGTPIQFKVQLPGLKTRVINTLVKPYHSTYLDLTMAVK